MHHPNNGRRTNIHQSPIIHHTQNIMNLGGPNMMAPNIPQNINGGRAQVISTYMTTVPPPQQQQQQQRDMNRLGQHLHQHHIQQQQQQQIPTQIHQAPQIFNTKGRGLTNINNNHVVNYSGINSAPIKHHSQNLQHISNHCQTKMVSGNHSVNNTVIASTHLHINDELIQENIRNGDIYQHQQQQQQQHDTITQHNSGQMNIIKRKISGSQQKPQPPSAQLSKPSQPQITILKNTKNVRSGAIKHSQIQSTNTTKKVISGEIQYSTSSAPADITASVNNKSLVTYSSTNTNSVSTNQCVTINTNVEITQETQIVESHQNDDDDEILTEENITEYKCGQISKANCNNEYYGNSKEKTPMCLINELARYNYISHEYRLTTEEGPAHKKQFTVTLKLGKHDKLDGFERYSARGPSIKKAQHTAAAEALSKTKYEHPPIKAVRHKNASTKTGTTIITPTVELNALAMKIGEPTFYVYETPIPLQELSSGQSTHGETIFRSSASRVFRSRISNVYQEKCQYRQSIHRNNYYNVMPMNPEYGPRYPPFMKALFSPLAKCRISLLVGQKKFTGIGTTVQEAKHDAASRALEVLKPIAEDFTISENDNTSVEDSSNADNNKSPISLVHEMALKRNFSVIFEVKSETGPPHMKKFITSCTVGTNETQGEGNGKKISKKRAAIKMLEELNKLPPILVEKTVPISTSTPENPTENNNPKSSKGKKSKKIEPNTSEDEQKQQVSGRKKPQNTIKEKPEPESTEINPISKLIQILRSQKEKDPIYSLIEEKSAGRRREFVMEVVAAGHTAQGSGSNKKIAKKNAALNILTILGFESQTNPDKENDANVVINEDLKNSENTQVIKPTELTESINNTLTQAKKNNNKAPSNNGTTTKNNKTRNTNRINVPGKSSEMDQTAKASKNTSKKQTKQNKNNKSPKPNVPNTPDITESTTTNSSAKLEENKMSPQLSVRPKDQLLYLADLLGFQAIFSDYPKGNHQDFLTIITLTSIPPQICHGTGISTEVSHDIAAINALEMLSKLGLDNVSPKNNPSTTNDEKVFAAADNSKN